MVGLTGVPRRLRRDDRPVPDNQGVLVRHSTRGSLTASPEVPYDPSRSVSSRVSPRRPSRVKARSRPRPTHLGLGIPLSLGLLWEFRRADGPEE